MGAGCRALNCSPEDGWLEWLGRGCSAGWGWGEVGTAGPSRGWGARRPPPGALRSPAGSAAERHPSGAGRSKGRGPWETPRSRPLRTRSVGRPTDRADRYGSQSGNRRKTRAETGAEGEQRRRPGERGRSRKHAVPTHRAHASYGKRAGTNRRRAVQWPGPQANAEKGPRGEPGAGPLGRIRRGDRSRSRHGPGQRGGALPTRSKDQGRAAWSRGLSDGMPACQSQVSHAREARPVLRCLANRVTAATRITH